jgi:hypothetical protein
MTSQGLGFVFGIWDFKVAHATFPLLQKCAAESKQSLLQSVYL